MGLAIKIKSKSTYFVSSLLEDTGADPNAIADDNTGLTAFQMALENDLVYAVALMINYGASLEVLKHYPDMINRIKSTYGGSRDIGEARDKLKQYGL